MSVFLSASCGGLVAVVTGGSEKAVVLGIGKTRGNGILLYTGEAI